MANIKNVILKKKIGDIIYELRMKTSTAMVYVDDTTTLAAQLTTMLADISDSKTKLAALLGDDQATSITGQIETAVNDAIAAIENEEDPDSLAGRIVALENAVAAINDESTGILATSKAYTDEKIGLSGTQYTTVKDYVDSVKTDLNASIAGAFHFKGTVDYVDLLPTEGVSTGDVYQVRYRGESTAAGTTELNAEYAYDGTSFVELGSVIDLSAYSTTEQVTSAINTAKQGAIDAAAADATSKANAAQSAAEATAQGKLDEAVGTINNSISGLTTTVNGKARFIVSEEEPTDLTESDVWAQVVE